MVWSKSYGDFPPKYEVLPPMGLNKKVKEKTTSKPTKNGSTTEGQSLEICLDLDVSYLKLIKEFDKFDGFRWFAEKYFN
jgi:hypothetical protein